DAQSTSFLWAEYGTAATAGNYSGHFTYSTPIGWHTAIVGITPVSVSPPTITGFSPTSGGVGTAVTINGSNFTGATLVRFNTTEQAAFTVVSAGQITTTVPTGATTGAIEVVTPGGTATSGSVFTVTTPTNPLPTTSGLSPSSAMAGSGSFTLTVNGGDFIPSSVVQWNGLARTTAFVSSTQVTASILAGDVASAGTAAVTVFNPAPGGGSSNGQTFTINNPVPTVTSLNPSSVASGGTDFTLTVNGTNFVSSSVVRWNGEDRATTFVSPTQLQAAIPASNIVVAGTAQVTVFNSGPGGGTSGAQSLLIRGVVAAYGFNEGSGLVVADSSGNSNGGDITGASWAAVGRFGKALSFDGSTSWVTINDANWLDLTTGMTLEAWVYPTVVPTGWQNILVKEQGGGLVYGLYASSSASKPKNRPGTSVYVGSQQNLFGGNQLAAGTWTHLAATYDGVAMRLFVDGTQVASQAQTGPIQVSDGLIRIGGNSGRFFNGLIDEVRIYNHALSAAQIQLDMNTPVPDSGPAPVPTTGGITPSLLPAGSAAFTLNVSGSNFVTSSVVRWNGANRATTYVSSSQVTASIPASDLAAEGTAQVTVFTPAPGGGLSGSQTFTITAPSDNPVPTATGMSPSSALAGVGDLTLTVNGTGFVASSVVEWNGAARATTVLSATQVEAAIAAADLAAPGTAQVTVFNPAPGGGRSAALTFTIETPPPVPVVSGLSPSSALVGGAGFTLTVSGNNFVAGAVVRWNGSARTTTFVSATELTASIPASDLAVAGTAQVTVVTSGGVSNAQTFTINHPVPSISSISPASRKAGQKAFTLTVTGSNFVSGSLIRWNGATRPTSFVSSTQLTTDIAASDIASPGMAQVTVINPNPGGGESNPASLTIR
ncbi:MAG: LamG-like jellyroll fold domain-containing protein, partial [Acidobacteriota bacterium]